MGKQIPWIFRCIFPYFHNLLYIYTYIQYVSLCKGLHPPCLLNTKTVVYKIQHPKKLAMLPGSNISKKPVLKVTCRVKVYKCNIPKPENEMWVYCATRQQSTTSSKIYAFEMIWMRLWITYKKKKRKKTITASFLSVAFVLLELRNSQTMTLTRRKKQQKATQHERMNKFIKWVHSLQPAHPDPNLMCS